MENRGRGDLQDDTRRAALGDLLHWLAIMGFLYSVHDVVFIWEATCFELGENYLPIDLNLKTALPSYEARHFRFSEFRGDNPRELLIAGLVPSSTAVFDFDLHTHGC